MDQDKINRFMWGPDDINVPVVITNDMLQCRDCKFRTEPFVAECEIYEEKPGYVLNHARSCKYFEEKPATDQA